MNTPQPLDPRDLRTCRACGHVFSRVHGTCPNCGALRDYRRKHKKSQRLRDRIDRAWYECKRNARRYKWYILYIGGGALIAMVIHPTAMFLAEFSRPPGWRDARWEAGWSLEHFFEPFVAAGETLWRWITGAVVGAIAWIGEGISWLLMAKPSLVFAAVVGGGIGAVLAWRRTRQRRRHRHRHRHHRSNPGAPTVAPRPAPPARDPTLDDWESDATASPATRPLPRAGSAADSGTWTPRATSVPPPQADATAVHDDQANPPAASTGPDPEPATPDRDPGAPR